MNVPNDAEETDGTSRKLEEDLFRIALSRRKPVSIKYTILIDAYGLYRQAYDGLTPVFRAYTTPRDEIERRPSAAEYVKFAQIVLKHIALEFERNAKSTHGDCISDEELKIKIRQLVSGSVSEADIPNVANVICFQRTVQLFGAEFNKSNHVKVIEDRTRVVERSKNHEELEKLRELRRRIVEDEEVGFYDGAKPYRNYNDFLKSLANSRQLEQLPGFYKLFVKNGKFVQHSEKAVDTSLAIASVSLAYEDRVQHQVFCVGDTDFLPVFEKLDELDVNYLVVYVGTSFGFPDEFKKLQTRGRLVRLDYKELCTLVIEEILIGFMHGAGLDSSYRGENADIYENASHQNFKEMHERWEIAQRERDNEYWADWAAQFGSH